MEVPAAVCWAVAPVGTNSITMATTDKRRKDQPVKTADSLPVLLVFLIAFSLWQTLGVFFLGGDRLRFLYLEISFYCCGVFTFIRARTDLLVPPAISPRFQR